MLVRLWCYAIGIVIGLLVALVYAQHGSWHDAYRSADGSRCCGVADCKAVPVSIIAHDGLVVEALVLGVRVTVPAQSVHSSEDTQSYVCPRRSDKQLENENIRCLFFAVGG